MSEVYETIKRGLEDAVNGRVTEHMVEYAPVVRCKDCKWSDVDSDGIFCEQYGRVPKDDWFCADGERKEGR